MIISKEKTINAYTLSNCGNRMFQRGLKFKRTENYAIKMSPLTSLKGQQRRVGFLTSQEANTPHPTSSAQKKKDFL